MISIWYALFPSKNQLRYPFFNIQRDFWHIWAKNSVISDRFSIDFWPPMERVNYVIGHPENWDEILVIFLLCWSDFFYYHKIWNVRKCANVKKMPSAIRKCMPFFVYLLKEYRKCMPFLYPLKRYISLAFMTKSFHIEMAKITLLTEYFAISSFDII